MDFELPTTIKGWPNLGQLRVFHVVAELGSIRAASRQLGLTQPAVTYQMRELERSLEGVLLNRGHSGVTLTPLGQALRVRAASILADLRKAEEEIFKIRDGAGQTVTIACHAGTAMLMLTRALRSFSARHPLVQVDVHEFHYASPVDLYWKSGQCDLVLMHLPGDAVFEELDSTVLMRTRLMACVRVGHPLAQARTAAELHECTWMLPPYGADFAQMIEQRLGLRLKRATWTTHSIQLALSLARSTDALALLSKYLLDDPWFGTGLERVHLREQLPDVQVAALQRKTRPNAELVDSLVECMRREV